MYRLLSSALPPAEVLERVKPLADTPQVDPSLPALYVGDKPFIGRTGTQSFTLRKRLAAAWQLSILSPGRWFQPVLHATVTPAEKGSEIFVEGGTPLPVKIGYALFFLAAVSVIPVLGVFSYPVSISFDPAHSATNLLFWIALLNVLAVVLLVIPALGWFLTRNELEEIYSRVFAQVPVERLK